MSEHDFLTERELDLLLEQAPVFDLDSVKQKTFSQIEKSGYSRKKLLPLRGLFIAAVICVLSVSALAVTDYCVTGGRIIRSLSAPKVQAEAPEPEAVQPEETPVEKEPVKIVKPQPKPMEKPAEEPPLPEMDAQIADALQLAPLQREQLRPAVQNVEQAAEHQDIRMTVLQTVGDPDCLYVKLRFDFPMEVSTTDEAEFDEIDFSLDQSQSYSWSYQVLERDARFVVYLLQIKNSEDDDLNGQTATLLFQNYGQPVYMEELNAQFKLRSGEPYTIIVDPKGNIRGDATAEDVAALPAALDSTKTTEDGFTISYLTDGTQVVTYDGNYGVRYVTILHDENVRVLTGDNPLFKAALKGSWSQSWQLSYEDTSRYWRGEESVFDPGMTMTEFRISPLSCSAMFTYQTYIPFDVYKEWDVRLLCEDGTQRDLPMRGSSYFGEDVVFPARLTQTNVFETPLDLAGVRAVLVDGKEFPLS